MQLIIPTDAAHETIAELGDLGLLQFKDLNPDREAFARTYASQVRFPSRFSLLMQNIGTVYRQEIPCDALHVMLCAGQEMQRDVSTSPLFPRASHGRFHPSTESHA